MEKTTILVADDNELFRDALCQVFKNEKDLDCVATSAGIHEAINLTKQLVPDIIIFSFSSLHPDVVGAIKEIKKCCPTTPVIIMTEHRSDDYVCACIEGEADGYLFRNIPRRELISAVRMVHNGQCVFSLEAISKFLQSIAALKKTKKVAPGELHDRELQVLNLMAGGLSNKEIASTLGISCYTVASHIAHILRKLGVESRMAATLHALKEGWLTLEEINPRDQREQRCTKQPFAKNV